MRFKGTIKGEIVDIFVDCGSASNLMCPKVAAMLGLRIVLAEPRRFTSVSWHPISIANQAVDVPVEVQGYEFKSLFCLLAVPNCDLLLGAPWLESLGMMGWHFLEKMMIFQQGGRCHVLKGLKSRHAHSDQHSLMTDVFCTIGPGFCFSRPN
ncbi:hypothetical protein ACLB2K_006319 [Fragaria x ananassa]